MKPPFGRMNWCLLSTGVAAAGSGDQMFSVFPNSTFNDVMLVVMSLTTVGIFRSQKG